MSHLGRKIKPQPKGSSTGVELFNFHCIFNSSLYYRSMKWLDISFAWQFYMRKACEEGNVANDWELRQWN